MPETCESWIKKGWIEEIQEPEFTETEILAFGLICYNKRYTESLRLKKEFEKFKFELTKSKLSQ